MTTIHLFFLVGAVLIQYTDLHDLDITSEPYIQCSSILFRSTCKAAYLLCIGPWEGGGVPEGTCMFGQAGPGPLSSRSVLSVGWRETRETPLLSVPSACQACLREGRKRLQQSISLSDSQMLLSLFISSRRSVTRWRCASTLGSPPTGVLTPAVLNWYERHTAA